ncbi:MAG: hypothetical protein LIO77_03685 [Rikenellaceae bacterium]|nr:hypothetical protein [Rikenellaceae bacterium]
MWTISDEQFVNIKASIQEEYMLRVCRYISEDAEFSWMLPQSIRDQAEKVLDKRLRNIFKEEKYCAGYVILALKYPNLMVPPVRDIKIIIDDMKKSQQEKIEAINYYINN